MSYLGPREQRVILRKLNYYHNLIYMDQDCSKVLDLLSDSNDTRNILVINNNKFLSLKVLLDNEKVPYVLYRDNTPISEMMDFFNKRKVLFVNTYDTLTEKQKDDVRILVHNNLKQRSKILIGVSEPDETDLHHQLFVLSYFDETCVIR